MRFVVEHTTKPNYDTSLCELWSGSSMWTTAGTRNRYLTWHQTWTHTVVGGRLDGSILLLRIRSTGLLIQIALLNGCERLLKYIQVLVSLVGIRAKSSPSLSLTHIKSLALCCPSGAWIFGVKNWQKLVLFTNIIPNLMNKLSLKAKITTQGYCLKHTEQLQTI